MEKIVANGDRDCTIVLDGTEYPDIIEIVGGDVVTDHTTGYGFTRILILFSMMTGTLPMLRQLSPPKSCPKSRWNSVSLQQKMR